MNWAKAGRWRGRSGDGERGASLVEFAFIVPVLALLLFGIIDFGLALGDSISQRQGVRDTGRQVAVGNWPDTATCTLSGPSGSADAQQIACLAKDRIDLRDSSVAVYVKLGTDGYAVGGPVAVCSAYPIHSASGFFRPLLDGRFLKTKVVMRIETLKPAAPLLDGGETDPSGKGWSWCTT